MTRSASLRSVLFLSIGLVTNANAQSFEQRAQVYMDSTYYADTTMVGLLVHVEAPDRSISWTGVSGRSEKGGAALQPEAPFPIASNIKTYVSATILRLVEEHQLNLNDPSVQRSPKSHAPCSPAMARPRRPSPLGTCSRTPAA
ncbi:MAG: serine hydrolase [Flavobacteriales bacterium]|nr:serine hydrolase [Flavobacteriales bacterium]